MISLLPVNTSGPDITEIRVYTRESCRCCIVGGDGTRGGAIDATEMEEKFIQVRKCKG